ncbi:MAG: hypothetical protein ACYDER_06280 [Ktedonobacteraceae bacterium]
MFLLTQCSFSSQPVFFACTAQVPHIDNVSLVALLFSVVLNWGATLLSTIALEKADASLVSSLPAVDQHLQATTGDKEQRMPIRRH